MHHRASVIALAALLVAGWLAVPVHAEPGFFTTDCASCHSDDTATCNGCHHHRSTLHATADLASYTPGDPVTITLTGGTEHGWVRGLLYDQNGVQIDIQSGPTGTGDDGLGNPVTFPVTLHGVAPGALGDYTWEAAWFGNNNGAGHEETRTPVTIHVAAGTSVPDESSEVARSFTVSPNPIRDWSTLRFSATRPGESIRLAIIDPSGRQVRLLWNASISSDAQQMTWDATDDLGHPVASGTYFAVLASERGRVVRTLDVMR